MRLNQKIRDFLYAEFDWVVREKDPKVTQLVVEFAALGKGAHEGFLERFTKTAASSRYTFDDLAKLSQYFAVKQILSSIADHAEHSLKLLKDKTLENHINTLHATNKTLDEALEIISQTFYTRIVLTGHPTEFASDETIDLIHGIIDLIVDEPVLDKINKRSLHNKMSKLFIHKLTPKHKLSVEDEISRNLKHLGRIYNYIPKIRSEILNCFTKVFGSEENHKLEAKIDQLLAKTIELRSWTGGDADGNFRIISDKMAKAVNLHKHSAAKLHLEFFRDILDKTKSSELKHQLLKAEPLIKDLSLDKTIELLEQVHTDDFAILSKINSFILLLKIFGKNVASVDVRQNMFVLSQVIADILSGVRNFIEDKTILTDDETKILKILSRNEYHKFLPKPDDSKEKRNTHEVKRLEILNTILDNPQITEYASNLHLNGWYKDRYAIVTEEIARMQIVTIFPSIFKNYIISNSEGASSVLQMLVLTKICSANPHIVPLFETKESLDEANAILEQLLNNHHYKKYLNSKSQKVMVGYSDSQKDNGICVLPLIELAIKSWQDLSKKIGIVIEVFHGNGLDLARGGPNIIESEQTFQGSHIRYTFLNYTDTLDYFSKLLGKCIAKTSVEAFDLKPFVEAGCDIFAELRSHKGYFKQLENYFEKASPFELFVKPNNFSSRPSKRNANDTTTNPYDIWFQDLVIDSDDIINGMRAIPWIITIEGTFTYFNLWYGFRKGVEALKDKYDIKKLYNESSLFREILKKVLIAIEYTDFEMAWRYIPIKDRPKNKVILSRMASKASSLSDELHANHLLALLNKEFEETKKYISTLKLELVTQTLDEIKLREKESIFLRSLMAWLNLKLVAENWKVNDLFSNPSKQAFEAMCGSIYLGFNEYRTVPKSYLTE